MGEDADDGAFAHLDFRVGNGSGECRVVFRSGLLGRQAGERDL